MAVSVQLIPLAVAALQGLVKLRDKIVDIRDLRKTDDPLPLLLPDLSKGLIRNPSKDPGRMQTAFSTDPDYRAALDVRGVLGMFDQFHANIDPKTGAALTPERHREVFWHFMGLYYTLKDEADGIAPPPQDEEMSVDRFIIRSAKGAGTENSVAILRAVAETLVTFLGQSTSSFLAQSPNKLLIAAVLREFATKADISEDTPKRLLKTLLGSIATAAIGRQAEAADNPAAALLLSALGRVRAELGDDFAARIIAHGGFGDVLGDWINSGKGDARLVEMLAALKSLDEGSYDPEDAGTLPAALQPIFGALQKTLGIIGDNIGPGQMLDRDETFRAVFGAVLEGVSAKGSATLDAHLGDDPFMAALLGAVISHIGRAGALKNDDLIAPLFADLQGRLAGIADQPEALSQAETILLDLANRVQSDGVQSILSDLKAHATEGDARAMMLELFAAARDRFDLTLPDQAHDVAEAVLATLPDLMATGLDSDAALRLAKTALTQAAPDGAFLADILPKLATLTEALGKGRALLDGGAKEDATTLMIERIGLDRAVWDILHQADHLGPILDSVKDVISGDTISAHLPQDILQEITDEALQALARHGASLSDLASAAADPKAFIQSKVTETLTQAISAAQETLGRGASAGDLPFLIRALLQEALSGGTIAPLTSAKLRQTVASTLDVLM